MEELEQERLDTVMRAAWFRYRQPAYDRGEFRGVPDKRFRDAFFLGVDFGRQECGSSGASDE